MVGGDEETPAALIVCLRLIAVQGLFDLRRSKRLIWATGSGNGASGRRKPEDQEISRKICWIVCRRGIEQLNRWIKIQGFIFREKEI